MPGPTLYIKNALKAALDGLGDGTVYASATSAVLNQSDRTFVLSGFSMIADIGANSDNKFNSYHLYFPVSKNKYLVVGWVASTNRATTWETPALKDTGPCEIRSILVNQSTSAGSPVNRLADGSRNSNWVSESNDSNLIVSLFNHIQNSGFESGNLSGWFAFSGAPAINGNAMVGRYYLNIPPLGRIWNISEGGIRKGKYRILFKATADINNQSLQVTFSGLRGLRNLDFSIASVSSGTFSGKIWTPEIKTVQEWHFADIIFNKDHDSRFYTRFDDFIGSTNFYIDEVSLFNVINIESIISFDDLEESGNEFEIIGYNAPPTRSNLGAGDSTTLLPSTSAIPNEILEFNSGIFPIYQVKIVEKECSEILLCEKWVLPNSAVVPFNPDEAEYIEDLMRTKSGIVHTVRHNVFAIREGIFEGLSSSDLNRYKNDWEPNHKKNKHPFAVQWEPGEAPLLMVDHSKRSGLPFSGSLPDWAFKWEEVL